MAQTKTGFYGIVPADLEAARFHRVRPPVVDALGNFNLVSSASGRVLTIGPGALIAAGIRHVETTNTSVTLPANSSGGTRWDLIGVRYDWAAGTAVLFSKRSTGTTITTLPALVRNPGVVYEVPLFVVQVTNAVTTVPTGNVSSTVVQGGFAGRPFRMNSATGMAYVDLPAGSRIRVGSSEYEVTDNNGTVITTAAVSSDPGPWPSFVPQLRFGSNFYGASWGANGMVRGHYHLENGHCHVKIECRAGSGTNFGTGFFSMDLPELPSAALTDQWGDGHLWTAVGDGVYDWPIKMLMRRDFGARGRLYAPTSASDTRYLPQCSATAAGSGKGVPFIGPAGTYSDPAAIHFDFSYLI